jgi:hypothetical protein
LLKSFGPRTRYKAAQMLRAKKDLHRAAGAKPRSRQVPKSKEPQIGLVAMDEQNRRHSCTPHQISHCVTENASQTQRTKTPLFTWHESAPPSVRRADSTTQTVRVRRSCYFTAGVMLCSVRHTPVHLIESPLTPRVWAAHRAVASIDVIRRSSNSR